jgi:4-diphosphocytidyl-2-C-methyl-D-erythritol kinase
MKKILAPAKINLYLHVTGKRPDGYHLLDSLMIPTKLCDVVEVLPSAGLELEVMGDFAVAAGDKDNIVIKAAMALAADANIKPAAKIILQKNIPVGAGLGGGSADAAAILKMLNEFWGIGYSVDRLAEIGLLLGADVPFCVYNTAAVVAGIGEVIKPAALPPLHILLVNPNKHLATKDVFTHKAIDFSKAAGEIPQESKAFIEFLKGCKNDLEANAIELVPQLADVLSAIEKQRGCLLVRMSGSGATCFGLFDNAADLKAAADNIKGDWWVFAFNLE